MTTSREACPLAVWMVTRVPWARLRPMPRAALSGIWLCVAPVSINSWAHVTADPERPARSMHHEFGPWDAVH